MGARTSSKRPPGAAAALEKTSSKRPPGAAAALEEQRPAVSGGAARSGAFPLAAPSRQLSAATSDGRPAPGVRRQPCRQSLESGRTGLVPGFALDADRLAQLRVFSDAERHAIAKG